MKKHFILYSVMTFLVLAATISCDTAFSQTGNVKIKFNTNTDDPYCTVEDQEYPINYQLREFDLPYVYTPGFEFQGWYLGEKRIGDGFVLTENITLKAKWRKVTEPVDIITPDGSYYVIDYNDCITLSCPTKDAKIYYTLDGSDPMEKGILYTNPIPITEKVVLKTYAISEGCSPSYMSEMDFRINYVRIEFLDSLNDVVYCSYEGLKKGDVLKPEMFPKVIQSDIADFVGWKDYDGNEYKPGDILDPHNESGIFITAQWDYYKRIDSVQASLSNGDILSSYAYIDTDQAISLFTNIPDCSIYYTLDETEPSKENGTLYTKPFKLRKNTKIKAIAYKNKMLPSNVSQFNIRINTYTVSYDDTYNRKDDLPTTLTLLKGDILTSANLPQREYPNYKFIGWKDSRSQEIIKPGHIIESSLYLYAQYEELQRVEKVNVNFNGEKSYGYIECDYKDFVTLETDTPNATIYYTTDGTTPSRKNGIKCKSGTEIEVLNDINISAFAIKDGMRDSEINDLTVEMKTYTIYYRDSVGSNSRREGFKKGDSFTEELLPERKTSNRIFLGWWNEAENKFAEIGDKINSNITLNARWELKQQVSPINNSTDVKTVYLHRNDKIVLKSDTPGVTIYYTTDGSTPTRKSNVYTEPIIFNQESLYIKAIATKENMYDSYLFSAYYNLIKYSLKYINLNYHTLEDKEFERGYVLQEKDLPHLADNNYKEFVRWVDNDTKEEVKVGHVMNESLVVQAQWNQYPRIEPVTVSKEGYVDYKDLVDIYCKTPGVKIYYKIDPYANVEPTPEDGTLCTSPLEIKEEGCYHFRAFKDKMIPSETLDVIFYLKTYTFKRDEPNYYLLRDLKKGYKLTETDLPILTYDDREFLGWEDVDGNPVKVGDEISGDLVVYPTVRMYDKLTLTLNPNTELIDYKDKVTLTASDPNAHIYYTFRSNVYLDENCTPYTGPIEITEDTTLRAFAIKEGMLKSDDLWHNYKLKQYTLDYNCNGHYASLPSTRDHILKGYKLTENDLRKLEDYRYQKEHYYFTGWFNKEGTYEYKVGDEINGNTTLYAHWAPYPKCENVTFSHTDPLIDYNTKLELHTNTPGATIYYSIDYNSKEIEYKAPIVITQATRVNAYAVCPNMDDSDLITHDYEIKKYTVKFDYPNMKDLPDKKKGDNIPSQYLGEVKNSNSVTETTFDGWYDGDVKVTDSYEIYKNVTLVPKWIDTINPEKLNGLIAKPSKNKITIGWHLGFMEENLKEDIKFIIIKCNKLTNPIRYEVTAQDRKNKYGKIEIPNLSAGTYKFEAYTEDAAGHSSVSVNDTTVILPNYDYKTMIDTPIKFENHFYFGNYPQTVKEDWVTVSSTSTKINGWDCFEGDDGYYYVKQNASPNPRKYYNGVDTRPGGQAYFKNGAPAQSTTEYYFRMEPIEWNCIVENYTDAENISQGKMYMTTKLIDAELFYHPYNPRTIDGKTVLANNYEHSRIRAYLNGISYQHSDNLNVNYVGNGLLQKAFSSLAINKLSQPLIDNSEESIKEKDGTLYLPDGQAKWDDKDNLAKYVSNNTRDKVFLASEREMSGLYPTGIGVLSDYALAKGAYFFSGSEYTPEILYRSPSYYSYHYRDDDRNGEGKTVLTHNYECISVGERCGFWPCITLKNY